MTESTSYETISLYMMPNVRNAMQAVGENERAVTEIRLRSGRAVSYIFPDRIKYLTKNGKLVDNYKNS